jgi:hypothetical protein
MEISSVTNALGAMSIIGIAIYVFISFRRAGGISGVSRMFIDSVNNIESAWVNLLAFIIPYAVSLIPAMMTFRNSQTMLGFEVWEAINAAAAIEFFGIVTMDTALRFYQYNKKYTKDANKAPVGMAVFSYVFYLAIIITVNVVMEIAAAPSGSLHWFSGESFWKIVALSLLSTLGFPSAVTIGIRTQHKEILAEKTATKQGGGVVKNNTPAPQSQPQRIKHASAFAPQITAMLDAQYKKDGRILPPKEITPRLKGLTQTHEQAKGKISEITKNWKIENGIKETTAAAADKFTMPKG